MPPSDTRTDKSLYAYLDIGDPKPSPLEQLVHDFIRESPDHPLVKSLSSIVQKNVMGRNVESNDTNLANLEACMKCIVKHHLSGTDDDKQADTVAGLLFRSGLFSDESVEKVAYKVTKGVNSYNFNAIALLRCIDCHAASLNDTAVSQYASIGNPAPGQALLIKRWQITELRAFIDRYIKVLLHVKFEKNTKFGEYIHLDYERQLRFLVAQYGLTEKAVRSGIQIAVTGDGAALTTSTRAAGQTCVGIKMVDVSCTNPVTGEPCFTTSTEDDEGNEVSSFARAQSADHCYPCAIVLSPESRDLVTGHFADFWSFFHKISKHGLQSRGDEPAFKPFDVVCPADMSFQQKTTGCGGACKAKIFFCHYCESNSHDNRNLFHETEDPEEICDFCKHNESTKCRHRKVNDAEEIERKHQTWLIETIVSDHRRQHCDPTLELKDCLPLEEVSCFDGYEIKDNKRVEKVKMIKLRDTVADDGAMSRHINDYLQNVYHSVEKLRQVPKIRYDPHAADKLRDVSNIEYDIAGEDEALDRQFRVNIMIDLREHGINLTGNESINELRTTLMSRLLLSYRIQRYKDALKVDQQAIANNRVMCPSKQPPCILHFHQRTIEKITAEIIARGLECCRSGRERESFVTKVNQVVNRDVFGRMDRHEDDNTGWRVPLKDDKKTLADITMDDSTAKMFEKNINYLIDVCLQSHPLGEEYVSDWKECMIGYSEVYEVMSSKKEQSFNEVCYFVMISDSFMERYIALTGRDGMTNYFHMLRDGHIAYALNKYGNLYRYSQQGWENINSVMKRSFHRGTQRGGGRGDKSKVQPIFLRMLRAAMWRMGHLAGLLFHVAGINGREKFQYGKDMKLPKFRNIPNEDIGDYAMTILKYGDAELIQTLDDQVNMTLTSDGDDLLFENELFGTEVDVASA